MNKKSWKTELMNKADKCYYCEIVFHAVVKTKDHIIPLAKRGKDIPENIVIACRWCNEEKGGKTLLGFFNHIYCKKDLNGKDRGIILDNIATLMQTIDVYYNRLTYKEGEKNYLRFTPTRIPNNDVIEKAIKRGNSLVAEHFQRTYGSPKTPSKETIERNLRLQSQTVEQFREKRLDEIVKKQLALPEPNFHY